MIKNLSMEQIEAILDALPIEFIFVDDKDRLQYANKGDKRSRAAPTDVVGKNIRACHKAESLPRVEEFINSLKSGEKDEEVFWVSREQRILNRFLAVRDKEGNYRGMIEFLVDFNTLDKLEEEKDGAHKLFP